MSEALNIIKAHFGALREVTTAPVWQYNYGQKLEIDGIPNLPSTFEIHYSNSKARGTAKRWIGYNGVVDVLNEYFRSGADIWGFIFLHEGEDDGETEYVIHIPVKERSEAEDSEPTPMQRDIVDETIAALNQAMEQCEAYVEHYPTVINGEWYVWDEASEQFVTTGVPATGNGIAEARLNQDYTLTLVFTDGTSFTTPISIRGAQGEKGDTGAVPNFTVGTVTTLPAGSSASASITGTQEEPFLNLSIPQGQDGAITNLDTTLTKSGKAADAKAVGIKIATLPSSKDVSGVDDDLDVTDEAGNVLVQFANGDIRTKNFDSQKAPETIAGSKDSDLDLADEAGNVLVQFANGDVRTKNFDSKKAPETIGSLEHSDLDLTDELGNALVSFGDGGIKTKNFDSAETMSHLTDFMFSMDNRLANPLYETREHYNEENPSATIDVTEALIYGHTGTTNAGYRIPSVVVTNAKTIIVVASHQENALGDYGDYSIDIRRKPIDGDWGEITTIVPFDTTREDYGSVLNNELLVDRNTGRIYLFYGTEKKAVIWWDVETSDGDFLYVYSDDDGVNWSTPVSLKSLWDTDTYDYCIPSCTKGITLTNGTLVVPCFCKVGKKGSPNINSWPLLLIKPYGGDWYLSSICPQGDYGRENECAVVEGKTANEIWLYCRPNYNYPNGNLRGYQKHVYNIYNDTFTYQGNSHFAGNRHNCFGIDRITISNTLIFLMTFTDTNSTVREKITLWASLDGDVWIRVYRIHKPKSAGYSVIDNYNGMVIVAYESSSNRGVIAVQDISVLSTLIYDSATKYIEMNISVQDRMQMLFNAAKGLD